MGGIMKIICINGQGGVGKDTFVKFCGNEDNGIFNVSMIDCIKRIASSIGWDGTKDSRGRKFLSDLRDLIAEYNDYPFQDVLGKIELAEKQHEWYKWYINFNEELICFVHVREPENIARWRQQHGAKALLIRREEVEKDYGNHADDEVFNIDYDYVIYNDGDLISLRKKANSFIDNIRKEEWSSNIWK